MPQAVAAIIRVIIQATVQTGILVGVSAILGPLVDKAKQLVADAFNLTPDEAEDTLANEVIDALAMIGIIGISIRTKLPTIVAERLGFTSKGYIKRVLSSKVPKTATGTTAPVATSAVVTETTIAKVAQEVATKRGVSFSVVQGVMSTIIALVGVPVGIGLLITNTIDFGAWNSSAYQGTFQKFLSLFGLEPDKDSRQPRTTSADTFNKIFAGFQTQGASTINDPYKKTIVPFTRDNLLDLADNLAGQILIEKGQVQTKTLLGALIPFVAFTNKPVTTTTTTTTSPSGQVTTTQKIQVFTGVVSQGVLGNGVVFSPRSNDMIDDVNELVDSASVNLANFLSALPSRVIYEIKIVSSITTKDGFTQRGSTNQIQVGTYSNGAPKYKTVTNKFAALYLYLLTDKGTRTKIATINVGPVNAVNFQVSPSDLDAVAKRLSSVVTTSDVKQITNIVSDTPIAVTPAAEPVLPLPNFNISQKVAGDLGYAFYKRPADKSNPASYIAVPNYKFYNPEYSQITEEEYRRATGDKKDYTNSGYFLDNGVFTKATTYQPSDINPPATEQQIARANLPWSGSLQATSIATFYDPNGKNYPSVAERALLYEKYGLGNKSLYIGSAEQNIRLLAKLKGF